MATAKNYSAYDDATSRRLLCGDLSEETRLPRELLERFHAMWWPRPPRSPRPLSPHSRVPAVTLDRRCERSRPFFAAVDETSTMSVGALAEVVRSLGVHSDLLCRSVSRVIASGAEAVSFSAFVRGYAQLHSRTLREALPFAFAVFDLDGDGLLSPAEFQTVLEARSACAAAAPPRRAPPIAFSAPQANLELKQLDPAAVRRVLAAPPSSDQQLRGGRARPVPLLRRHAADTSWTCPIGLTRDQFRYFASLSSETVLATCGFLLHVSAFYVPLYPLGPEAEEEAEREAEEAAAAQKAAGGGGGGGADGPDACGASAVGESSDGANPFEDSDMLAALESLKTTPEERAERQKGKGNEAMRSREPHAASFAVERYSEGLAERPRDARLRATLLANRAAAHTSLKNWRRALDDAKEALAVRAEHEARAEPEGCAAAAAAAAGAEGGAASCSAARGADSGSRALAAASQVKAARRGAAAALRLGLLAEAKALSEEGLRLCGGGGESEAAELRSVASEIAAREAAEEAKRVAAAARAAMEEELAAALRARGLAVGEFLDEGLRQQCVGEHAGARLWYDSAAAELHSPVLLLYPEASMSDFIQDVAEGERLADHLEEMFGEAAERSPPWDTERKYAAPALQPYLVLDADGEAGVGTCRRLDASTALLPQLAALCAEGYTVPGVPIVHVVVRRSAFEREFLRTGGAA